MAYRQTSESSGWWWAGLVALVLVATPAHIGAQQVDSPTDDPQTTPGQDDGDATDRSKASVESQLVFALSAYHAFPTRAELDDIGDAPTITRLLRRFATAKDTRPSMKTRAVDALGYYADATTRAFLQKVVQQPESLGASARVADLMRHHAITSLAKAHGDAALQTLSPLLDDEDVQIQMTAIVALGKHGGERAHQRLRELRKNEKNRMILRQIDKYAGQGDQNASGKLDSEPE